MTRVSSERSGIGAPARSPLYNILIGLTSLAILLQGVWAGMFIREGKANNDHWVSVHDWGARIAFLLAIAATVVAFLQLRARRDLLIGTGAMVVLLFVESAIGGEVGDKPGLEVIHFPLAMALLGLAVWLPLRARAASRR